MFPSFKKAPTRFELVIEVLQTFALPLGHGAILLTFFDYNKSIIYSQPENYRSSDSNGNRTRVTAVKGRCLNRLPMEP